MASVIWALPSFISLIASVTTGIWAFVRNTKNPVNRAFALWMGTFAIASVGAVGMVLAGDEASAVFWTRFQHVGIIFMWASYAFFTFRLLGKRFNAALLYAPFALIALLLPTDLFIKGTVSYFWGHERVVGALYPALGILNISLTLYVLYSIGKAIKEIPGKLAKEKLTLLAVPTAIPFLGVASAVLPAQALYLDFAVHLVVAFTSLAVAYALVLRK